MRWPPSRWFDQNAETNPPSATGSPRTPYHRTLLPSFHPRNMSLHNTTRRGFGEHTLEPRERKNSTLYFLVANPPSGCERVPPPNTARRPFGDGRTSAAQGSGGLIITSQGVPGGGAGVRQQPGQPLGRDEGADHGGRVACAGSPVGVMLVLGGRVPCVRVFLAATWWSSTCSTLGVRYATLTRLTN